MKRQIRRGVYETNSSSCHSLVMCTESEYDAWEKGDMLLYTGWGSYFGDKPEKDHFYTRNQAINFEKHRNSNPLDEDLSDVPDEELNKILSDRGWVTCDEFFYDEYLEAFEETYTTPGGEKIVAFGKYGYDN